jgi:PST family polysaccharide transporter
VHELVAVFSLPCSAVVLILARPVTIVVLGQGWEAASAVLAAYSLYAIYVPMTLAPALVLSSQGRGRDLLLVSCFTSTITILAFGLGLRFGLAGVAMSYSLSCLLIQLPIIYWITGRVGVVTARDLWNGVLRHLPLWGIVAIPTWLTRVSVASLAPATQLLICIPVALLSGTAAVWLSPPSHRAASVLVEIVTTWARGGAATRAER